MEIPSVEMRSQLSKVQTLEFPRPVRPDFHFPLCSDGMREQHLSEPWV